LAGRPPRPPRRPWPAGRCRLTCQAPSSDRTPAHSKKFHRMFHFRVTPRRDPPHTVGRMPSAARAMEAGMLPGRWTETAASEPIGNSTARPSTSASSGAGPPRDTTAAASPGAPVACSPQRGGRHGDPTPAPARPLRSRPLPRLRPPGRPAGPLLTGATRRTGVQAGPPVGPPGPPVRHLGAVVFRRRDAAGGHRRGHQLIRPLEVIHHAATVRHQIRLTGVLDRGWSTWFDSRWGTSDASGQPTIAGPVPRAFPAADRAGAMTARLATVPVARAWTSRPWPGVGLERSCTPVERPRVDHPQRARAGRDR
jgi:hypothetical protein